MIKVKVYNSAGEALKEMELNPQVFGVAIKPTLVQQVVEAQLANGRQVLAHAKGRSEVRGGGRKPWKQKGTGRARHGSIRSPLWRGGGITFGPTKERNFAKAVNKKAKRKALQMVLSDKVNYQSLILVEDLAVVGAKTKKVAELLNKLPIKSKSALIVLDKKNEQLLRGCRNLPKVDTLPVGSLNVVDLLKFEYLLTTAGAIKKIEAMYKS